MSKRLILAAMLALFITKADAVTFSGTITLPNDTNAGASGMDFDVGTYFLEFYRVGNFFFTSSTVARIPAFGTTANFSFQIPSDPTFDTHNIDFECTRGCANADVTTTGLWSISRGAVGSFINASDYNSRANQVINIQLETADTFSGQVALPKDFVAKGDEQVIVRIRSNASFSFDSYVYYWYPDAGQNSTNFRIGVPSTATASGWKLEYPCNSCDAGVESETHFPTKITGNPPSLDSASQFFYQDARDYSNIKLSLISLREPPKPEVSPNARKILGAISLLLDDDEESVAGKELNQTSR